VDLFFEFALIFGESPHLIIKSLDRDAGGKIGDEMSKV
jgi:hypothetical protein